MKTRIKRKSLAALCFSLFVLDAAAFWLAWTLLPPIAPLAEDREFYRKDFSGQRIERPIRPGSEQYLPYEEIPYSLRKAVILLEDHRFRQHRGIDILELRQVIRSRSTSPRLRGASTLTQQLARNLYLSGERTWNRKSLEALIAMKIELQLSKERILELYLNSIDWGENLIGIEAAARHYFGKRAATLSDFESLFLAALIPNPRLYSRDPRNLRFQRQIKIGLERLYKSRVLDLDQYLKANEEWLAWREKI